MAEGFFDFHEKVTRRSAPREKNTGTAATGEVLSVSQLTTMIESAIRSGVPERVLVKGEVSNFKLHSQSGHLYFTLKDADACIDCVMFRSDSAKLKFTPRDGMELLAGGRVSVFPQRGRYQLYLSKLEPLGQGALELAFRQLCEKLAAEGLFDPARKKPIPRFPSRIALVTSTSTAALQDMLKVLRRFAWVRVMVYHVPVQGEGSAKKIAAALDHLNQHQAEVGGVEVILLGRGGGSLEDLWEFNEEIVARAVAASHIPIITGIGHEVDVSVADLVADYHAHTPTEAAQVATAQWRTARDQLDAAGVRLRRELRNLVSESKQRLSGLERHEFFRRPLDGVNRARQLLDDRQRALAMAAQEQLAVERERLTDYLSRLRANHPRHQVGLAGQKLVSVSERLNRIIREEHRRQLARIEGLARHLNAVGPQQVLDRGYSITTDKKTGQIIRRPSQVKEGQRLVTRLADGKIESQAVDARQLPLFE